MPTVSVVMPTFNRADRLHNSISSILSQDFDDLELLIVDDGLTDNTSEVVSSLQSYDARIRYEKLTENRGVGFARDAGMQHVTGKYIVPADADDLWLPGKLSAHVRILDYQSEIDILFGDCWHIDHLAGTRDQGYVRAHSGPILNKARNVGEDLYIFQ